MEVFFLLCLIEPTPPPLLWGAEPFSEAFINDWEIMGPPISLSHLRGLSGSDGLEDVEKIFVSGTRPM